MDEMKLHTKFMRSFVSKIITKIIFKKLGYKIDIQLNEIEMKNNVDGKMHIHIDFDADMDEKELLKMTKLLDRIES